MLAHASQLLRPCQAGTEVTLTSTSSPRRHLLAACAPGHLGDLPVAAPTLWTPHSPPCSLPHRSPSYPNGFVAAVRHHRGHCLPLASPTCPEALPPSSMPLCRLTRRQTPRSAGPVAVFNLRPPEIPLAAPLAPVLPRARRGHLCNRCELTNRFPLLPCSCSCSRSTPHLRRNLPPPRMSLSLLRWANATYEHLVEFLLPRSLCPCSSFALNRAAALRPC